MTTLREAAQQFVADYDCGGCGHFAAYAERFRKLLAQEEQATGKNPLQVDPKGGMQIATPLPLTTTDLAWLETRRLVRVWQELGQIRWAGADQGWDRAIEAVRARLDKECQDVLAWKERRESQGLAKEDIAQNLQSRHDAALLLEERRQEITQPRREQEPVAWRHKGAGHFTVTPLVSKFPEWEPLYTAPPRREWQGLTEEEREAAIRWAIDLDNTQFSRTVARAIEQALKEKNA